MTAAEPTGPAAGPGGERAVPYFCPYCADEDLRPRGATPGSWHCRACARTFQIRFLGIAEPEPHDGGPR